VRVAALVLAAVFALLAGRSAIYWFTHRLELHDATDELLFAAFVTGRVGTWLVASGMFAVFGSISAVGQAYVDEASGFTWLFLVFLGLGAIQFLAGWFLGVRGGRDVSGRPEAQDEPRRPGR
jgi:hypothetical protein